MDIIFDIDGTLANAEHRLHHIKDMAYWTVRDGKGPPKPDWETFLSDEKVSQDSSIIPVWEILLSFSKSHHSHRIVFVTGRNALTRDMTLDWLMGRVGPSCIYRESLRMVHPDFWAGELYMRSPNDRRPSHEVKRDLLKRVREDGYHPQMAFDDRKDDAAMWRSEGLICCQVAEGDY